MHKPIYILLVLIFCQIVGIQFVKAQAPEKMSYQAVIRDSENMLIENSIVGVQISIVPDSVLGFPVYIEKHTPTTNTNGLFTLEIGTGEVQLGEFSQIDWGKGPYFLKTETDPLGNEDYTITGISQLLSVPFALHAKTASHFTGSLNENDPRFTNSTAATISQNDVNNWNSNVVNLTGNETQFNNWDKNANDDFSGRYRDLSGKPTKVSSFSNDAGYIKTESDPDFNNSAASGITNTDVTNLGNLSGINTGDQNLSGLALQTSLNDSIVQLRSEISAGLTISETDPVFNSSIAAGITQADTAAWNAASIGSYTETDPVFLAWNKSSGISITKNQVTDLTFDTYEKELSDNENNIDVGFSLSSTSVIYINGTVLPASQWSGTGTQTLILNIKTKQFDKLKVTQ